MDSFLEALREAAPARRLALVLSGGNALGAFQAGVYESLSASGIRPDWLVGGSIGAVNATLVAGGPPEEAVARLRAFWAKAAEPELGVWVPRLPPWRRTWSLGGALFARLFGRPGVFEPHFLPTGPSLYDLAPLGQTLEKLVDFERIARAEVRLTIAATDAESGEAVFFDNRQDGIGPQHVLASCAWPPDFPPAEIDGRCLLDAGLVANTPLDPVLGALDGEDRLCIAVDLFDRAGPRPRSLESVLQRRQNLVLGGQTVRTITAARTERRLRAAVHAMARKLPPEASAEPEIAEHAREGSDASIVLVHLPYRGAEHESPLKMFDYSRASIEDRWRQGRDDAADALRLAARALREPRRAGLHVHEARTAAAGS